MRVLILILVEVNMLFKMRLKCDLKNSEILDYSQTVHIDSVQFWTSHWTPRNSRLGPAREIDTFWWFDEILRLVHRSNFIIRVSFIELFSNLAIW
jgi:hypothetical protein